MPKSSTFTLRHCQSCDSNSSETLISIKAQDIANNNWSYRKDFDLLLNISGNDTFDIVTCSDCGFIYSKQLPNDTFLNILYDQVIDLKRPHALKLIKHEYPRRLHYLSIVSHLLNDNSENVKVLDFGAGFGQTSKMMQAQGMQVVAYDTSDLRCNELSKSGIRVIKTESEIIENGPYALIICDNVLEHVPNPKMVIELFKLISKTDTILFISVPSYEKENRDYCVSNLDMSLNPWEHLNYFDQKHLDAMLSTHGFFPIPADQLGNNINIGLRHEASLFKRMKNGLATFFRLLSFIRKGVAIESVNSRFYRLR